MTISAPTIDIRRAADRFHTRAGWLDSKHSEGNRGLIYPGLAQRMSAGRGIWHSEKNASTNDEVHFIQMWVLPDTASIDPGYQQLDINDELAGGGLVPIASGQGHDGAISIHQRDAVLWGARLGAGERVRVPDAGFGHVFIARGSADLDSLGSMATGDAARLTHVDGATLVAGGDGAEVLIWTTGAMP